MDILKRYRLGRNMAQILGHYCEKKIVPKEGKFLGRPFDTGRGFTQGDPVSPMIFNINVDAVIRTVLEELCGPQEVHQGMGWAAWEINLFFYANDG